MVDWALTTLKPKFHLTRNAIFGQGRIIVHNKFCRVEKCRRLSLTNSAVYPDCAFSLFHIPGVYVQSTKYLTGTSDHLPFFVRHIGTSSTLYVSTRYVCTLQDKSCQANGIWVLLTTINEADRNRIMSYDLKQNAASRD